MAKKRTKRNLRTKSSSKKGSGYYFRIFFLSVFVGAVVFFIGSSLFKADAPCANSASCGNDLSLSVDNNAVGYFQGHKVIPPKIDLSENVAKTPVLGASASAEEKHIYVDLATQTLYAYQGSKLFMQTLIASGKWGKTPVGNFHIWEKLRSTRMAGGEGADAYDLPNVPYVMYFYNDFGLHGAYWHNNFGHTMSHGCVNMRQVDAAQLFDWADGPADGQLGTAVSVCNHFTTPGNCQQDNPIN